MKLKPYAFLAALFLIIVNIKAQNIGINATGATPNNSSILDLNTGNTFTSPNGKGILPPNVSLTSITDAVTVSSPPASLLIFNTSSAGTGTASVIPGYYYWGGTQWIALGGSDWHITGNVGTTPGTNFLGTTDAQDVVFKTNNLERSRILATNGNVGIGTTVPGHKLDVVGDINTSSAFRLGGTWAIAGTANDIYGNFRVLQNNSTLQDGMYINLSSSGTTTSDLRFYANGANERMHINASNGNVGIGTSSPGARLEINNGITNGAIKIIDGTQGIGKVLTSDANGVGTWKNAGLGAPSNSVNWDASVLTGLPIIYPSGSIQTYGPFTVPVTGWYTLKSRWFIEQNPAENPDMGAGTYWIQINDNAINLMDQPSLIYEIRGVINAYSSCPPSGAFMYMSSGTSYYVHQTSIHGKSSTGGRLFTWVFVQ